MLQSIKSIFASPEPVAPTAEQRQKLEQLLAVIHENEAEIVAYETPEERIAAIQALILVEGAPELSDRQIRVILEQPNPTVDDIIAQQSQTTNPNRKIAINMALGLGIFYYSPGIFATLAMNKTLAPLFKRAAGDLYGPTAQAACNFAVNCYGYSPYSLASHYIPRAVEEYGHITYAIAPASIWAYQKGPSIASSCAKSLWNLGRKGLSAIQDVSSDCYSMARFATDVIGLTECEEPLFELGGLGFDASLDFEEEHRSLTTQFHSKRAEKESIIAVPQPLIRASSTPS